MALQLHLLKRRSTEPSGRAGAAHPQQKVVIMRTRFLLAVLFIVAFSAGSAQAVLGRFDVRTSSIIQFTNTSPKVEFASSVSIGTSVVDNDAGSGNPILKRYQLTTGGGPGRTTDLPGLSGFIWTKGKTILGPTSDQIGTGDTGGIIDWGLMSSFTVTGGQFCHSVPASVCDLATRQDSATVTPALVSSKFSMRLWAFHGTGWTGDGYVAFTSKTAFGNSYSLPRGVSNPNGTVPALPLVSIVAVGISVLGLGMAAVRRRR